MRGRVLLWISLGLNVALAVALLARLRDSRDSSRPIIQPDLVPPAGTNILFRTNTVVRRLNFVWSQIESSDYRVYIANLRDIGCPEATIRDIIVAEVNQIFARRRATEVVTSQQQWWRPEPDSAVLVAASAKLDSLEAEREALLTDLLGPQWESSYYPFPDSPQANPLDGPLLGVLPSESQQAVREVERRSRDRRDAYLLSVERRGKEPDEADLDRLRQQTRSELAAILTPEQLEEYLLRYSQRANKLRSELLGLDTGPDEFRALFRQRDSVDQELQTLSTATDAAAVQRRLELEQKRNAIAEQVLGPAQYREYKLNQDPLYRDSRALAVQIAVPEEKIMPFYNVNQTTELEQQRIRDDTSLTSEQRALALEEVRISHAAALKKLLGDDLFERYQRSAGE